MKSLAKNFINGIIVIVPIIIVVWVIYKTFLFLDGLLGNLLRPYMEDTYIPGIGLLVTIALITFLGFLSTRFITGKLIALIDKLLEKIPFVKTIYSVIKDTVNSFLGEKKSFSKVALITIPGTEIKSLGFITSEELESFHEPLKEYVAVYVQQTFQVAGFTFLIPKEQVEILDVKPEDAMKFILSGGMAQKSKLPEKQ
ncbi:hypothetical protein AM500_10760 [Bacillus sp. FJAT-18017]|uniref:DUF502 domain-containing protein n=1 Tax=Bacillus sp. FJAT-18017 TaxID=1705566 RepID=UPI0006AF9BC4|nr:DUF502 domain-containing protein [Bacillus sp. FJAT-18017]ALC90209.1 hypothetical protein AM500_10760 [Bacillus sp. FJAT-18017]